MIVPPKSVPPRPQQPPKINRSSRTKTTRQFRDRMDGVIEDLHEQLVRRGINEGLVDPTTGVQDGTFIAACASRHERIVGGALKTMLADCCYCSILDLSDVLVVRWRQLV